MPYAKATFNDLLLSLSYRYGETTVPSSGIDNRKYWINRGIEYCMEQLDMTKSVSVTVASGVCNLNVSTANPAPDFKSISELRDSSNAKYTPTYPEMYGLVVGAYFCITGDHGTGYVLKAKNDGVYTLWYRFYTSPLVNTTDICIISDPEAVAAYAYAQIRLSETDPLEDAQRNLDECTDRISKMGENVNRNGPPATFKPLY